jgi:hypothetical protein
MDRHAYLIMANGHIEQLKMLLSALDYEGNDIYLHYDAKSDFNSSSIMNVLKKSRLFITPRIKVYWGDYSQIEAEMILLEAAHQNGPYQYYHLLTGVDFPLQSQKKIHEFFHGGNLQYVHIGKATSEELSRVRYYHFFMKRRKRDSLILKSFGKILVIGQKMLFFDRIKGQQDSFAYGSAYFDITEDFVSFILSKKDYIEKVFHRTCCADELFIQHMLLISPFKNERFVSDHIIDNSHDYDILRYIDWKRGNPYVFTKEDLPVLLSSECFFARKFDLNQDKEILELLLSHIKGEKE